MLLMTRRPYIRDAQGNIRQGETIDGALSVPIGSGRVEQCRLDNAFSLAIEASGEWWLLKIEVPFDVASPQAASERFGSDGRPSAWGSAADALLNNTVADASVTAEGVLRLAFADGTRLDVEPSQHWEAWQLEGPGERLIVCGPGGQLSRWPRRADGRFRRLLGWATRTAKPGPSCPTSEPRIARWRCRRKGRSYVKRSLLCAVFSCGSVGSEGRRRM